MARLPTDGRRRVVVCRVRPEIDGGRFPAKRLLGEEVAVDAVVFADGHDDLACRIAYRHSSEAEWRFSAMKSLGNDQWSGEFAVTKLGRYQYSVEGWIDRFETWRHQFA